MTTTTQPRPAPPGPAATRAAGDPGSPGAGDLSFRGVLAGEWVKLLSLRSTWWTAALTVVVIAALGAVQASAVDDIVVLAAELGIEPHGAELVIAGFQFGMVTVAVLGALLVTGEYSTGTIRSTLVAVPSRLPVLWAKALALVALTVVVSVLSLVVATVSALPWLADANLVPALDDAVTWQSFAGMTYFFVAVVLIALGLGAVLRHTAATVSAVLGLLLLVPGVLQFVPLEWVQDLVSLTPLPAAVAFVGTSGLQGTNDVLTAWQGVAVVGGYAVLALVAGAVCLRRRDA
ncbi:ABC-2 type transport system permease protein [Georgenia satyanarayanai]|uniref:ABC-2 type transport system permease protein n=1 Tax=Georgenia satyanarayanai TaxID=860221 RepID=A0A2Y9C051_9MICO|nr:ABC transporter permease subunit [Georgenia satyanarayanai]PYF97802.1 ABC-2 type transport system permease protein [Georgenia satyanarayanai]SSA45542.1 ABC-2 type transport system permease protein [Georgenia satyanarayanai]